jgi:DNA-damage-inducible protein D
MTNEITKTPPTGNDSPFERIKRTNAAGNEYWSSRDFSQILGYSDYRNFEQVIKKAKAACFNSGQRIDDHFVDITEMVDIGSGAKRPICLLSDSTECRPFKRNCGFRSNIFRRPDQKTGNFRKGA